MEAERYIEMAEVQDRHWWFTGRKAILSKMLLHLDLPDNARILEVGCGTGANLAMLQAHGAVFGIEMDDFAREHAQTLSGATIEYGRVPDVIPFGDQQFDLICLFDVLEHIEEDTAALKALGELLSPEGKILITVPAIKWLYGHHDESLHHFRRYSRGELIHAIERADLQINLCSFFNSFLLPLAVLARVIDFFRPGKQSTGMEVPSAPINRLFHRIFSSETPWIRRSIFPTGLSLLAIMQKKS